MGELKESEQSGWAQMENTQIQPFLLLGPLITLLGVDKRQTAAYLFSTLHATQDDTRIGSVIAVVGPGQRK